MFSLPLPKIRARQIEEMDLAALTKLLNKGFPMQGRHFWARVLASLGAYSSPAGLPKYGYLLESDGTPVGVILLIFSRTRTGASELIRCNVSSWYVEHEFRTYSTALISRAITRNDVTYLNTSPAPHTRSTIELKGFVRYNQGVFVCAPAFSLGANGGGADVLMGETQPNVQFDPLDHNLLLDHAKYGCISMWCLTSERAYPFIFRPRAINHLSVCAQLIYCRDIDDFVRFARPIGLFLIRRGKPLVILDANGPVPGLIGKFLHGRMPKYFKGPDRPRLGDLAYTETAMFGV